MNPARRTLIAERMITVERLPAVSDETKMLLERCHSESFGWARLCCGQDAEEAENVLQAVYLKVMEGKAVFDGRSAFRTWLFSVIRMTAAEARRRRVLEAFRLRRYHAQPRVQLPRMDEAMEAFEAHDALRRALRSLPRRQAEVLQLVFYHDLSLDEAASVMGVSVGSARTHYERGKKKLRVLLEQR